MSPELFTSYTSRHTELTKELAAIKNVFNVVVDEMVKIYKKHRGDFGTNLDRYFSLPSIYRITSGDIINIDEDEVDVTFTIWDDDDQKVSAKFNTKLFHDYYFNRATFDTHFEQEYSNLVSNYNHNKSKEAERAKNKELELFLTLKEKFEGPLT